MSEKSEPCAAPAIELRGLVKTYPGGKTAVNGVSVSLAPGEVFGFLGPNGAGKTTTVKLLCGMLAPTGGSCTLFGMDPAQEPERIHAISGVVTEHAQMYDSLTGLQNLAFYGELYGLGREESRRRAGELLEQLELSGAGGQKLAAYSTGMRQRLSLARALLHRPKILFLDEPTSGLDPESAQNVHRMIRSLARENQITVFLCTHQLRYAQEICTRYGLMAEGRLLAEGTLDALRAETGAGMKLAIRASKAPEDLEPYRTADGFEIPIRSEAEIPQFARRIMEFGGDLYHVSAQLPSLEDIYFTLTKEAAV